MLQGGRPTGEIVVIELHVPEPTHARLREAAAALGVSVERLFVMGLDSLLKQIEDAKTTAATPTEEQTDHGISPRVAPRSSQRAVFPPRPNHRYGHR